MFIITNKNDNRILNYDVAIRYLNNGYPLLPNENIYYPTESVNVFEVEEVPSEIEIEKYCYTEEDGFYPNENYREPSAYDLAPTDVVNAIIDEYTNELIESGVL